MLLEQLKQVAKNLFSSENTRRSSECPKYGKIRYYQMDPDPDPRHLGMDSGSWKMIRILVDPDP